MVIKKIMRDCVYWLYGIINSINMGIHGVRCGTNLKVRGRVYYKNGFANVHLKGSNIIIGNDVSINSSISSNPIGGSARTILNASFDARIFIENDVAISNTAIVSRKSITIEEGACIGAGCKIYDTDFHSIYYNDRTSGNININSKAVVIGKKSFIGAHSIILKGVTIGQNAVIGAGSVVTKNVPDYEIWAGNPAKFIKKIGR